MDWELAYTPYIWPSIFALLLMLAMALYSARRRNVPGVMPFMIGSLLGALWAAGSAMEFAAVNPVTKVFWVKFEASWQLPAVTAVTCFALEYARPGRWLTRRNLALLSIAPLLLLGFIWTDSQHHLMWRGFSMGGTVSPQLGVVAWAALLYSFGLVILNIIVFVWLFVHSPPHRWPVAVMITGHAGVRAMFVLDKLYVIHSALPLDVLGLAFMDLLYAIALFGFRLFDPIPLARQAAIEQLRDGMLVVDAQGRVASLNPAAERMLGIPASRAKKQSFQDVLAACYPDDYQTVPDGTQLEITLPARDDLGSVSELRHYTLRTEPLKDWRGTEVGCLLLLHDVTDQKRAQAQIIEQQRSLAMLGEREQLARELHDSTAQVLGYADFQLEAISNHIEDGRAALCSGQTADVHSHLGEARTQLTRLRRIVEDAHADLREYILNLRSAPSERQPFFATMRSYLDGFSQNYGIQTELTIGPGIEEGNFALGTQLQLVRIIQEALSNARKHSAARCVQVSIERQDSLARISIQDDGCGFDPASREGNTGRHFGLRFMSERAEQIGGTLRLVSAPGHGTCVSVELPMKG